MILNEQFDALANNADRLYLTNVNKDELWDCYINSYPEDERQSHTCNCCRQFIKPYGNVVAIVNNKLVSIWDSLVLDEPYATVARNLAQLVKSKPVCDVFVSKVVKLGTDKNNVWIETPTRHVHTMNSERELERWQKVNSAETKEQLFEAVDFICADEPNGLIGTTGKLFTADKLKRSINAAITGRFNANVVTRRYGLRQQVLYLMYYGIE